MPLKNPLPPLVSRLDAGSGGLFGRHRHGASATRVLAVVHVERKDLHQVLGVACVRVGGLHAVDLVGGGHALAARENGGRQGGDERKAVHHDDSISREMIFDYTGLRGRARAQVASGARSPSIAPLKIRTSSPYLCVSAP